MNTGLIVVDVLAPRGEPIDLRTDAFALALDQRAFGPRQLLVAFGTEDGQLTALVYAGRTDPPDLGLEACLLEWATVDLRSRIAVAFSDEPVALDAPRRPFVERLDAARRLAAGFGVHLVDWIACDDQAFRSFALSRDDPGEWWRPPEVWPERQAFPGSGRLAPMPRYAEGRATEVSPDPRRRRAPRTRPRGGRRRGRSVTGRSSR